MLIAVVAFRYATAEDVERVVASARVLQRASRSEPGLRHYAWSRDLDDPLVLHVVEVYDDRAALEAHLDGPALRDHLARTAPIPKEVVARRATDGGHPVDVAALRHARQGGRS